MALARACALALVLAAAAAAAAADVPPPPPLYARGACPCASPSLCDPTKFRADGTAEVFAFTPDGGSNYAEYDWSRITTLAWVEDDAAMCRAHARGARAVSRAAVDVQALADPKADVDRFALQVASDVYRRFLDGANFDMEQPAGANDALAQNYIRLISRTSEILRTWLGNRTQVSVDVPWAPWGVDGRWYDFKRLVDSVDLAFVMAYDMQSQVMQGRCIAAANSPYELVRDGLHAWAALAGPDARRKLVLGLPWYGYHYPCLWIGGATYDASAPPLCALSSKPFRGVKCSDAAGREVDLADIVVAARGANATMVRRDGASRSPAFEIGNSAQVWFDDAPALREKYKLAADMGIGGIGMWHADALHGMSEEESATVWRSLDVFLKRIDDV